MNFKKTATTALAVFVSTLVATGIVTLLWNIIFHGNATLDWEASFRFAIILGIVLTWLEGRKK